MSRSEDQELLEREPELARLELAIARAAQGVGQLIVIEGAAGIGKTTLMHAGRARARSAGLLLLHARAIDLEQEFAFGVARQLFEPVIARAGDGEREEALRGAAGLARQLVEPSADWGHGPALDRPATDRTFTLVHGLYWLAANLADQQPLMVTVDDAHWADAPSLRFLAYLASRLDELPTVLMLTVREGEPASSPQLLGALRGEFSADVIEPRPLSGTGVATMVRSALGDRAEPEFCAACLTASAGNPFLLHELLAELRAERVTPVAARSAHVVAVGPRSVSRAVLARLTRLGRDATELARAIAVLETASLRHAAALAGLDAERAREAADLLVGTDVLATGPDLMFVHPLLRRAVYDGIPPAARDDGHRRAGLLLAADRAGASRAGAHLMRSAPTGEARVPDVLRAAAREALADGAPSSAARLLRRALTEPPADDARGSVLAELGQAEALERDPAAAEHLSQAMALTTNPDAKARLACLLGEFLLWSGRPIDAHEVVTRTAEEVGADADLALRAALETIRAGTASVERQLVAEIEPRLPLLRKLGESAGAAGRSLLIFEACWRAQRGPYDADWRELLDRGLDSGRFIADHTAGSPIVDYAAAVLVLADEVPRAQALLSDIRADARGRGSIHAHLTALAWGSLLALRRGDLLQAEADARTTLELAGRHQVLWTAVWCAAVLSQALTERGQLHAAEEVFRQVQAESVLGSSAALHALFSRGRLRLEQGRIDEAIVDLRAAGDGVIVNNPNYVPWRSTLAVALRAENPSEAGELAEAELERARELGQPRGIGVALRACGVIGRDGQAVALLSDAVDVLRASPARLELARALCELGSALRRAGQRTAAREPLREAMELAMRLNAPPLAHRARDELEATGARPRRERLSGPDALTPSERRVAELAASGLTNREIAQSLFVTTKTVGTHLGHIYQKLDLQGADAREQIATALVAIGNPGA